MQMITKVRKNWTIIPVSVFLVVFFLYPVAHLLQLSFLNRDGAVTSANFQQVFTDESFLRVILRTLQISAWTTVFAILAGYPVAYFLSTVSLKTKNLLIIFVLMPFWTSFLVRAFAWMIVLGRKGVINETLIGLGLIDTPIQLNYNFTGVMIGMVHALAPLGVLTMLSTMEKIDKNLIKAATTLGARRGAAFWLIFFPLSLPGVVSGALLIFISALGFFITPALLGGAQESMISQVIIFQIQRAVNWNLAGALSFVLLAIVIVLFFIYDRLFGMSKLTGNSVPANRGKRHKNKPGAASLAGGSLLKFLAVISEKVSIVLESITPSPKRVNSQNYSRVVRGVAILFIAFLVVPTLFIIPESFTTASFLSWPPVGFTTKWYEIALHSDSWVSAIARSVVVALLSACLSMLLGVPAAFFVGRSSARGKGLLFAFLIAPMIVPSIVIAVALFYFYSYLGLVGTTTGLVLGHTVLAVPYVVIAMIAVVKGHDQRLDKAALTLGAGPIRVFRHVISPLMRSGFIAAFTFAFIISLDELTVALFVTGGEMTTLPKQMWDDSLMKVSPLLAAVASMLLVFMTTVILLSEVLRRRGARVR
jgi:ABC-type spermidine/putrescine transport system permease subunit I